MKEEPLFNAWHSNAMIIGTQGNPGFAISMQEKRYFTRPLTHQPACAASPGAARRRAGTPGLRGAGDNRAAPIRDDANRCPGPAAIRTAAVRLGPGAGALKRGRR